jgi:uncharacterized protein (TIGR03382 family)
MAGLLIALRTSMRTTGRLAAILLVSLAACTDHGAEDGSGGNCIDGKCDAFGGAEKLADLSTKKANGEGNPSAFTVIDSNKALFWGHYNSGLWVTDGTPSGTKLVRDIAPVMDWQEAPPMVALGGKGYWTYQGTLWVSDGTPMGTKPVVEFGTAQDRWVSRPIVFNGKLMFGALEQIYVSDGTAAGTSVLAPFGFSPGGEIIGTKMYFPCSTKAEGQELCVSDGTSAGTKMIKDITPGIQSVSPRIIGSVGGKVLFSGFAPPAGSSLITLRGLWVSDGTDAGTTLLVKANSNGDYVDDDVDAAVFGDYVYYTCFTSLAGSEMCRSDGTLAGTTTIDLFPGGNVQTQSSSPSSFTIFNDKLYFIAKSPTLGRELWVSDGTLVGSSVVVDVRTVMNDKDGLGFDPLIKLGNKLVFESAGNSNYSELWSTDGTAAGTKQITDITPDGVPYHHGASTYNTVVLGNKLLFSASDGTHGSEPYVTDGTMSGTSMLVDLIPEMTKARAYEAKTFTNATYLAVEDEDISVLWKTNGTAAGTASIQNLHRQASPGFTIVGSTMFYRDFYGLWKTDGTTPTKVAETSNVDEMLAFGNLLAFAGSTPNSSHGLFVSDGTAAGTIHLGPINARRVGVANGRIWLTALMGSSGNELWTSDGTTGGTRPVANIHATKDSEPAGFVAFNGKTLFSATDTTGGRELWSTDGTMAGTQRVADLVAGTTGSGPWGMTVWNGTVLMWASTATPAISGGSSRTELWRTDGTAAGTTKIKSVSYGGRGNFISWGNYAFFVGTDDKGSELWRTDGTEAGTVRVADIYDGAMSSNPEYLVLASANGPLYFAAEEPTGGRELWTLAAPTGTPTRTADILPGPHSSRPANLQTRGSALLFTANAGNGEALFRLGAAPDIQAPKIDCPDDITLDADADTGAVVTFAMPTATDNDGTPTVATTPASGDMFPVGTTTVTATATDPASNTASCTFDVIVTYSGNGSGSGSGSGSGGGGGGGGGGPDEEIDDGSGGCSTTTGSGSIAPILVMLIGVLARRRRRR